LDDATGSGCRRCSLREVVHPSVGGRGDCVDVLRGDSDGGHPAGIPIDFVDGRITNSLEPSVRLVDLGPVV
jgi:hypothetical protein